MSHKPFPTHARVAIVGGSVTGMGLAGSAPRKAANDPVAAACDRIVPRPVTPTACPPITGLNP